MPPRAARGAAGSSGKSPVAGKPAPPTAGLPASSSGSRSVLPVGYTADELLSSIDRLKQEQEEQRRERNRVAKELRNATRRKSRLKKRARQLSNEDLVAVMLMRQHDQGAEDEDKDKTEEVAADAPAAAAPVGEPAAPEREQQGAA